MGKKIHYRPRSCGLSLNENQLTDNLDSVTCKRCLVINTSEDLIPIQVHAYVPRNVAQWLKNQTNESATIRTALTNMQEEKTKDQVIICVYSNSGGTSKSTTTRNLAHGFSLAGKKVVVIDLDPQHNLDLFFGCEGDLKDVPQFTSCEIFSENFQGWPIEDTCHNNVGIIRGHLNLKIIQQEINNRRRREFILADRLSDHPIDADIILIDCPATLGLLVENANVAATHRLIPVIAEEKSLQGIAGLIQSINQLDRDLRIHSAKYLGILPTQCKVDSSSTNRLCLNDLEEIAVALDIDLLPKISYWEDLKRANANGKSLKQFRPGHKGVKEFDLLTEEILKQLS